MYCRYCGKQTENFDEICDECRAESASTQAQGPQNGAPQYGVNGMPPYGMYNGYDPNYMPPYGMYNGYDPNYMPPGGYAKPKGVDGGALSSTIIGGLSLNCAAIGIVLMCLGEYYDTFYDFSNWMPIDIFGLIMSILGFSSIISFIFGIISLLKYIFLSRQGIKVNSIFALGLIGMLLSAFALITSLFALIIYFYYSMI